MAERTDRTGTVSRAQLGPPPRDLEMMYKPFPLLEVGESFKSPRRTITESDIVGFAALTGDWHPQHTDAVYAAESIFGARVAHGMLLLSYAVGLVPNDKVIALRRLKSLVFKRPVFHGDTIRVLGRIDELTPFSGEAGLVSATWTVENQDRRTVCKFRIEALWRSTWG